jgi:hypothetical protein
MTKNSSVFVLVSLRSLNSLWVFINHVSFAFPSYPCFSFAGINPRIHSSTCPSGTDLEVSLSLPPFLSFLHSLLLARILQLVTSTVPTAGNLQSYRIVVVTDPKVKAALHAAAHRQDQVLHAPYVLVFLADDARCSEKYKRRSSLFSVQDATNACMMTSLACAEEGLGTCWVGAFHDDAVAAVYLFFVVVSSSCSAFSVST